MRGTTPRWFLVATLALGTAGLLAPISVSAGATTSRSIQDFIAVQGTTCFPDAAGNCILFTPPVQNYVFWSNGLTDRVGAVDYAGLEAAYLAAHGGPLLGTTFSGTVSERALADGRAEVRVVLHTHDAVSRAWRGSDNTPLFGYSAPEILSGARPAMGDSLLELTYINPTPGMPLADLGQLGFAPLPGQQVVLLHFSATAAGGLRSGFGVREGTPGQMHVNQVGLIGKPFAVRHPLDPFAVELVDLHATGG
jgi:hypothetical protein